MGVRPAASDVRPRGCRPRDFGPPPPRHEPEALIAGPQEWDGPSKDIVLPIHTLTPTSRMCSTRQRVKFLCIWDGAESCEPNSAAPAPATATRKNNSL